MSRESCWAPTCNYRFAPLAPLCHFAYSALLPFFFSIPESNMLMETASAHPIQPGQGPVEKGTRNSTTGLPKHNDDALTPRIPDPRDAKVASIHGTTSHLHGFQLVMVTLLNMTMLFLVQTEIFIVTTSIVAIAEEVGEFEIVSWVLASYFLGYVSR
jgi:hypothetical protein